MKNRSEINNEVVRVNNEIRMHSKLVEEIRKSGKAFSVAHDEILSHMKHINELSLYRSGLYWVIGIKE